MGRKKIRFCAFLLSVLLLTGCSLAFPWEEKHSSGPGQAVETSIVNLLEIARGQWPERFQRHAPGSFPGSWPDGVNILGPGAPSDAWRDAYYSYRLRTSTMGIYTGPGAEPVFWRAIAGFLDHHDIAWESFDETQLDGLGGRFDAIWFGGGFSSQYRRGITHHQLVRDFVEEGGAFIGICAGAYYATTTMRWHGGMTDYPLNLFPGDGIGPLGVVAWGESTTIELEPEHLANHQAGHGLEVYYMDGPYFTWEKATGIEVIASYGVNQEAAVISFPYGQGRALLIGPHPEMGYDHQTGRFTTDGSHGAQWEWLKELLKYTLGRSR